MSRSSIPGIHIASFEHVLRDVNFALRMEFEAELKRETVPVRISSLAASVHNVLRHLGRAVVIHNFHLAHDNLLCETTCTAVHHGHFSLGASACHCARLCLPEGATQSAGIIG